MYSGSGGGADRSERRRRRGSRHQVRAREDDAPHELYASRSGPQLGPSNSRGAAPESFVTGFLEANSELSSPSERSTLHSPVAGDLSDIVRNGSNPVASSAGIRTVDLADIARNVSNQPAPSAGSRSFDLDGLFAEDRFAAGKPSDEIPKWLDPPSVSMTDPSSSFRTPEFSDPELQKQVVIDKSAIRSKPVALMPYDMPVPHPGATKQKQLVLTKEWPEEMNIAINFTRRCSSVVDVSSFPSSICSTNQCWRRVYKTARSSSTMRRCACAAGVECCRASSNARNVARFASNFAWWCSE